MTDTLLGIAIGVYFTLNVLFTWYALFSERQGRDPINWRYILAFSLLPFAGCLVLAGIAIYHYANVLHKWIDKNNWYYRWLNDTLRYEAFLGQVNRMNKRSLRNMQGNLKLVNWPRRKLSERIDERLKEMEQ